MGFLKDFKAFAMRGNVVDLAVGVIIGGAFGKIVSAMVDDILMPVIGLISGGQKFDDKFYVLKPAKPGDAYESLAKAKEAGANVFAYGHFIQSIVEILIITYLIFIFLRLLNRLEKKKEEAPASSTATTTTEKLLMEIRDTLKNKS